MVAKNAGGSNASATWSFTTQVPPPAAPVLSAPANGAADIATLTYSELERSQRRNLVCRVLRDVVASSAGDEHDGDKLYVSARWPAEPCTTGRWWPSNAGGSNGSPTWSFTTQTAAPSLVSPVNGAIGVSAPTLTWNASTGAASYDVYFGTQAAPPLVTNIAGTSYTPGTLSPGRAVLLARGGQGQRRREFFGHLVVHHSGSATAGDGPAVRPGGALPRRRYAGPGWALRRSHDGHWGHALLLDSAERMHIPGTAQASRST